ncbi:HNH endonuclease signature motif containing protein [Psychrobacillus sp. PGGUH221]|uniref:HNH endonuclease n=1 Tax=Psychrobacillus sp. PGGUH221 TaxID=3020058 RepID=UPI0035C786C4
MDIVEEIDGGNIMGLRVGYIYNELQLLLSMKERIWSTKSKYKYYKVGDLLVLITSETYTGIVALARFTGEPYIVNSEKKDSYTYNYPIEYVKILLMEDRVKMDKNILDILCLGRGLSLNQNSIEGIYQQKAIKPKSYERFILNEVNKFPNFLNEYVNHLDVLIAEANERPEMHWTGNEGLSVDEENVIKFPIGGFQSISKLKVIKSSLEIEDKNFYSQVQKSLNSRSEERQKRINNISNPYPNSYNTTIKQYYRNPDVIAEVLIRANGICEKCEKEAPFKRASDGTLYLEVHHIKGLADGGDDTVENAMAVCPNCHREFHFGQQ